MTFYMAVYLITAVDQANSMPNQSVNVMIWKYQVFGLSLKSKLGNGLNVFS